MWPFSDKTWARIGKVAPLVGVLGIVGVLAHIVNIYKFFAPLGPDLVGYCSYSEYVTSPDNYQMLINIYNIRSGKYTEGIQKALSTLIDEIEKDIAKSGNEKIDELNRKILTNNTKILLQEVVKDLLPSSLDKSGNPYPGTLDFIITNNGNELAKDVALSLPFEGKAYLLSKSKNQRVIEVKRSVELGDIRQGDTIRVLLWSTEVPNLKHEAFIRLTHSSGFGKISFAIPDFGFPYTILRDHDRLIGTVVILLFFGAFIGYPFLIEALTGIPIFTILFFTRSSKSENITQSTASASGDDGETSAGLDSDGARADRARDEDVLDTTQARDGRAHGP